MRNLPYAAGEEDIISFFSACGEVLDVRRGMTEGEPPSHRKGNLPDLYLSFIGEVVYRHLHSLSDYALQLNVIKKYAERSISIQVGCTQDCSLHYKVFDKAFFDVTVRNTLLSLH